MGCRGSPVITALRAYQPRPNTQPASAYHRHEPPSGLWFSIMTTRSQAAITRPKNLVPAAVPMNTPHSIRQRDCSGLFLGARKARASITMPAQA